MLPEVQFFVGLVRSYVAADNTLPAAGGVDWERLERLLLAHRMLPALAPLLHGVEAPQDFRARCDEIVRKLHRRSAVFLLELSRFLPALEDAGCRPMVLKGAALGRTLYTTAVDRFVSDLDLLVPRERVDEASEVMTRFGYRRSSTTRHPEFYERHHFHRILESPSGVTAELHWDLTKPADFFRIDIEGFYERSRIVQADGTTMRVPSHDDQLIHAASQSLDEGFSNLWRAVDAALLVRAGLAEPAEVAERARAYGLGSALWVLLKQVREVCGVEPPAELQRVEPKRLRRVCFDSLEPSEKMLSSFARQNTGHRLLLEWLCTPDFLTLLRRAARFLVPGEARYLSQGHDPARLPGPRHRVGVWLRNAWTMGKIVLYQGRCLATHRR